MRRLKGAFPGVDCLTVGAVSVVVRTQTDRLAVVSAPETRPAGEQVVDFRRRAAQSLTHADAAAQIGQAVKASAALGGRHSSCSTKSVNSTGMMSQRQLGWSGGSPTPDGKMPSRGSASDSPLMRQSSLTKSSLAVIHCL